MAGTLLPNAVEKRARVSAQALSGFPDLPVRKRRFDRVVILVTPFVGLRSSAGWTPA
jgi:hypothetical protein